MVEDISQGLTETAIGNADGYLCRLLVCNYYINRDLLVGVEPISINGVDEILKTAPLHLGIRSDWPEIVSMLDKAKEALTEEEFNEIKSKWLVGLPESEEVIFTDEEKAWVKKNPVIVIGVDPEFLPFDGIDENGEYIGIGAEYIDLIEERTGLSFKLSENLSWPEVLEGLKDGTIDIAPVVAHTTERDKFLDLTSPHTKFKDVIFTEKNNGDIKNINDLTDKKVVFVESYATYDLVFALNPDFEAVFVSS